MAEKILLEGDEDALKPIITLLLAQYQMLENRDIGQFVGDTYDSYVRNSSIQLGAKFIFSSHKEPPFYLKPYRLARYNVPDIKKEMLNWENIKRAVGGTNGYDWGRFRATANLIGNSSNRKTQMQIHGATEAEARERLEQMLTLSDTKILTLTIAEEKREFRRMSNSKLYKAQTRMYGVYLTILNQRAVIRADTGRATLSGNIDRRVERLQIWPKDKPALFEAHLRKSLLAGDVD